MEFGLTLNAALTLGHALAGNIPMACLHLGLAAVCLQFSGKGDRS